MKALNKLISLLLCLILLAGLLAPAMAAQENDVVRIYTAKDLIKLSEQCALDSWSQGKTVLLERDIDLSLTQFQPIPTFGGTFDGQGHTISGLNLRTNGDIQGLFRYIQTTGIIQNLIVDGSVLPVSHKNFIGGIAGRNFGTISHCLFRGTLKAEGSVGGIAGINETSGQIISCSFTGAITGNHYVGGIVGRNLGSVVQCRNSGSINTTEVNPTVDLEDLDLEQLNSTANMPATTDIGGIAGFSSGTVQSCHNTGNIGYPHMGYNIGGIVGRQSGYLDSCTNTGLIQGRKDVGGIAGQMEPQLVLNYDQTALDQLWNELDSLEAMIDAFLEDTDHAAGALTDQIQGISHSAASVKDATANLSSAVSDWADGSIDQINDASARITWVLERMVPVSEQIEGALGLLELAADLFSSGLSESSIAAKYGADAAAQMDLAINHIRSSASSAQISVQSLRKAMELLTQALGDSAVTEQALQNMADAAKALTDAFGGIADGLGQLYQAMDGVYEWIQTDPAWEKLQLAVGRLGDVFALVFDALGDIARTLEKIAEDDDLSAGLELLLSSTKGFLEAMGHLGLATRDLLTAYDEFRENGFSPNVTGHLDNAAADLNNAWGVIDQAISDLLDGLTQIENSEAFQTQLPKIKDHLDDLENGLNDADAAIDAINAALDELAQSDIPDAELENIRQAADAVTDALAQVADAAKGMSSALSTLVNNIDPSALEAAMEKLIAAMPSLESAIQNAANAMTCLESAMNLLASAANGLADALDSFSSGGRTLADAIGELEQAAAAAGNIMEELSKMPAIGFEHLEGSVTEQADALNTAADGFINSFNALNGELRNQSNLLTGDLQAVNAQLGNIADLLQQFQQETAEKDMGSLMEDVSAKDCTDNISNGKISHCENTGTVNGDLNVAGIVGSLAIEYDFDPEDDLVVNGDRSLEFAFLARAVVRDCTNYGTVTAKKNYTGGIVGLMDLGRVIACQSYGPVTSTSGNYVGGIAGTSAGGIVDSWAKSLLSGQDYIGGIAGFGTLIQGCRSLISLDQSAAYVGAIAGQVEDLAQLTDNQFVHHRLAGVDGISYAGAAQPISYEQLCGLQHLPDGFTEFELTFTADGKTVAVIPFQYGDSLAQLPAIPEKQFNSARWPELDYSCLRFSQTIEAIYTPYDTALSDGQTLPTYLISGSFSPDAVISVTESEVTWGDEPIPAYTVTVTDPQAEQIFYTLHWRLPEDGDYDLWVLYGSEWVKEDYTPDGSYLLLTCSGEQITFCLTEQAKLPLLLGLVLLAVLIIVIVIIVLVHRSNRKKKQLTAAGA